MNRRIEIPPDELRVSFARSGGPGGQNVNKVESKVVLRFSVAKSAQLRQDDRERIRARLGSRLTAGGELVIHASSHRQRARNLEDARERLAAALRAALAPRKARRKTRPTRASVERRIEQKRRRSDTKRSRRSDSA